MRQCHVSSSVCLGTSEQCDVAVAVVALVVAVAVAVAEGPCVCRSCKRRSGGSSSKAVVVAAMVGASLLM